MRGGEESLTLLPSGSLGLTLAGVYWSLAQTPCSPGCTAAKGSFGIVAFGPLIVTQQLVPMDQLEERGDVWEQKIPPYYPRENNREVRENCVSATGSLTLGGL